MMNIFISGSISIGRLPKAAVEKIDNIIERNYTVLVGDAKGVDLHVQQYLLKKNYHNIVVYFAGNSIRNNVGNWQTRNIKPLANEKGRELYTLKDKAMARDADYGLMIWDGQSQGTLNNIMTMKAENKRFFVIVKELLVDDEHIDPVIDVFQKQRSGAGQLNLF